MDKILINNIKIKACHGCLESEQYNKQLFEIDIELGRDLSKSMEDDSLQSTVDYSEVIDTVKNITENQSFNLLEKLANVIINEIFEQFPANLVKITIRKPNAKIDAKFDYVGVEIERANEK